MSKRFGTKNSDAQLTCDGSYCASNTVVSAEKTVKPNHQPKVPNQVKTPAAKAISMRPQSHQRTVSRVPLTEAAVPEASKIRLIVILQKLQALSLDYRLLSQYFERFLSRTTSTMDTNVIMSALVFDKEDLKDSQACYTAALNAIDKTRTTDFSSVSEMIDGLSQILQDFK